MGDEVFLRVSPTKGVMRFRQFGQAHTKIHWCLPHYLVGRRGIIWIVTARGNVIGP